MELLFATHNQHKKEEIQQILGSAFTIKSLTDYQIFDEIVEDGHSFEENALIKAKYCFEKTGVPSVGDDSGLVVQALDGRPGIYSARYAGDHDFDKNMAKVLEELEGKKDRSAYFITVLCYYNEAGAQWFTGKVPGFILKENIGHQGFGYDPIFVPAGYQETFAEMKAEEKNKISHRKQALDLLLEILEKKSTD